MNLHELIALAVTYQSFEVKLKMKFENEINQISLLIKKIVDQSKSIVDIHFNAELVALSARSTYKVKDLDQSMQRIVNYVIGSFLKLNRE